MTRYIKQRDETSCGPVAILNIYKWMGYNKSYKDIKTLRRVCDWKDGRSKNGGVRELNFEKALKLLGIKKKRRISPTLKEIDNHIDLGGVVVIGYNHPFSIPKFAKKDNGHFTLCVKRTNKTYTLINDSNKTIIKRSKKILQAMITHKVDGFGCWAWLIYKD